MSRFIEKMAALGSCSPWLPARASTDRWLGPETCPPYSRTRSLGLSTSASHRRPSWTTGTTRAPTTSSALSVHIGQHIERSRAMPLITNNSMVPVEIVVSAVGEPPVQEALLPGESREIELNMEHIRNR